MPPLPPPIWIATPNRLQHMAAELARHSSIAVDTESNSLHAYREQVCLIQFSIPNADYLVDPLALDDLSPLAPVFANPNIEKIFHAAEYDVVCLRRDFHFDIVHIFDTMQSARILGYEQVGLDALLKLKFDITLNKRYQKADWATRPLSEDLLNYARFDTHYLHALRDSLKSELDAASRSDLAREEFARLAQLTGNGRAEVPGWHRISGKQKFTERQLTILKELCEWRDIQASRMDRPPFKVIDDKRMIAIAESAPTSMHELEEFLTLHQVHRFGADILSAVSRGRTGDPVQRPRHVRPSDAVLRRLDLLNHWRRHSAQKHHLESDIILPKGWMHAIAEKNPQTLEELSAIMKASPWRLEHFGTEILKVIAPKTKKSGG
jgi:ribonuclease D